MSGQQPAAGGWVPEFEGQRPPFEPGNDLAVKSGGRSPRKVEPLARDFVEQLLGDESTPQHVKALAYRTELWALGRAEAQVQLFTEWLMAQAEAAGNAVGDLSDESVRSAYLYLHRAETRAASARSRLGLTPVSAARLGKHVAQGAVAQADVALRMAQLHELEKAGWTPPAGWSGEQPATGTTGPDGEPAGQPGEQDGTDEEARDGAH